MDNPKKPTKPRNPSNPYKAYIKYSGLAFQMMAIIGICTWIGIRIDGFFSLKFPLFTILMLIISLVGVIYWLIQSVSND